jgi:NADPH:quinone reductase-like Zn-dependent oxidoreductase
MKAIEYYNYGSPEVLKLIEVEKPEPRENEVLIKIFASTVTSTESAFRQGNPFVTRLFTGLRKPKLNRLGEIISGEVVAVGNKIKTFQKGDKIFGTAGPKFGANAEFICLPENGVIAKMDDTFSYKEAAASVDGFLTAMPFLRDTGKIKKGQKILIYGASGSVGSSAIQIAKYFETEVTAVCSSSNLELVKSLGADKVIDYTKENYSESQETYDIIFDAVGKTTFSESKKVLKPNGVFLEAGIDMTVMFQVLKTSILGGKKARVAATGLRAPAERNKDLQILKELLSKGIFKSVIDKTYSFEDISVAHAYVDTGRKRGSVIIEIHDN